MRPYTIIDIDLEQKNFSIHWHAQDELTDAWVVAQIPSTGGQWVTGADLDRYLAIIDPAYLKQDRKNLDDQGRAQYTLDTQWLASVINQTELPASEPQHVILKVIEYRQSQFWAYVNTTRSFQGDPVVFDQLGTYTYTVPMDRQGFNLSIWAPGGATWDQGPGGMFNSYSQVQPGDTVTINLGTQTSVSSAMGTIEVGIGWDSSSSPRERYKIPAWGHIGQSGIVIIY